MHRPSCGAMTAATAFPLSCYRTYSRHSQLCCAYLTPAPAGHLLHTCDNALLLDPIMVLDGCQVRPSGSISGTGCVAQERCGIRECRCDCAWRAPPDLSPRILPGVRTLRPHPSPSLSRKTRTRFPLVLSSDDGASSGATGAARYSVDSSPRNQRLSGHCIEQFMVEILVQRQSIVRIDIYQSFDAANFCSLVRARLPRVSACWHTRHLLFRCTGDSETTSSPNGTTCCTLGSSDNSNCM